MNQKLIYLLISFALDRLIKSYMINNNDNYREIKFQN